jgi:hypothetical protein
MYAYMYAEGGRVRNVEYRNDRADIDSLHVFVCIHVYTLILFIYTYTYTYIYIYIYIYIFISIHSYMHIPMFMYMYRCGSRVALPLLAVEVGCRSGATRRSHFGCV